MCRHSIQYRQDLGGWGGSCTHCQLPATDSKHFVLCSLQNKQAGQVVESPCPIPMCRLPKNIFSQFHLTKRYMPNCMENEDREPSFASLFPPQVPSSRECKFCLDFTPWCFWKENLKELPIPPHPIKAWNSPQALNLENCKIEQADYIPANISVFK